MILDGVLDVLFLGTEFCSLALNPVLFCCGEMWLDVLH